MNMHNTNTNEETMLAMCAEQQLLFGVTVKDADKAIEFYKNVLGAEELFRVTDPDGRIPHCGLRMGDTIFSINSEFIEAGKLSAETLGGSPVALNIRVADANMAFKAAIVAGSTKVSAPTETYWGDLTATVKDPFGNLLSFSQNLEALTSEEIIKRAREVNAVSAERIAA